MSHHQPQLAYEERHSNIEAMKEWVHKGSRLAQGSPTRRGPPPNRTLAQLRELMNRSPSPLPSVSPTRIGGAYATVLSSSGPISSPPPTNHPATTSPHPFSSSSTSPDRTMYPHVPSYSTLSPSPPALPPHSNYAPHQLHSTPLGDAPRAFPPALLGTQAASTRSRLRDGDATRFIPTLTMGRLLTSKRP